MTNNKMHSATYSTQNVALGKMRVAPLAQRKMQSTWVDELLASFEPEMIGLPTLNLRSGHYYIIDGQHRIEALKRWLGDGYEKQNIPCRVFNGLSERDEARMFLRLNKFKAPQAFDKFRVALTGELSEELAVLAAVEKCGLSIAREKRDGNISCVGTLLRVFRRADAKTLSRCLNIANNAFGHQGLTNQVVDGMAMVCERYNGELRDAEAIERLHAMRGGVGALLNRATVLRKQTAQSVPVCVAAAAVEVINRGGGKKLPAWWKE